MKTEKNYTFDFFQSRSIVKVANRSQNCRFFKGFRRFLLIRDGISLAIALTIILPTLIIEFRILVYS